MTFTELELPGVWLIDVVRHGDARGYFCETFRQDLFDKHIGHVDFIQENESRSFRGVMRGLHYQAGDASQAKLVRVAQGEIIDVAVDLRADSPTFGRHVAVRLDSESGRQLYVPRGFAHGFAVLSESATFLYKVDNAYNPSAERVIKLFDSTLAIDWPFSMAEAVLSQKDSDGESFPPKDIF